MQHAIRSLLRKGAPYTITHNTKDGLIESHMIGMLSEADIEEFVFKIIEVIKEKNCFLILSDYQSARINLNTFETYEMAKKIAEAASAAGVSIYKIKRALVIKDDVEFFSFFETISLNQSQNMRIFHNVEDAKQWLLAKEV